MGQNELMHYGTKYHSGRYPWGSGENPYQRLDKGFLDTAASLKKKGLTDKEIVEGLGLKSINQLRAYKTIARENQRIADREYVLKLKAEGKNNSEIGRIMGKNESSIRSLLDEGIAENTNKTRGAAEQLKKYVADKKYVDIGPGTELDMGITSTKLKTAVAMLEEEGYHRYFLKVNQLGTDHQTTMQVLCAPETKYSDMIAHRDQIKPINETIKDVDGSTLLGMAPRKEIESSSVNSSRIQIKYAEQGGTEMDGVIELRRGVDDISLGSASYAQVRIPVDGTHYLKGMAIYSDNLPPGVDIRFNTNKHEGTPKLDCLKKMKNDEDNPFGATIKGEEELKYAQKYYIDKDGNKKLSAINVVNEEGDWGTWSKTLASQFLSKQSTVLAKKQLNLAYADRLDEYNEINNLSNPSVKKVLLEKFADNCDSAAVDLKAAALPGQASKVILPVQSLKPTEIYAPTYENGASVCLVRYPHGGQFEIPSLIVNNNHKDAKKILGNAIDAVGINSKVAERLSGADFDGDTVLVLPTSRNGQKTVNIQTKPQLQGLKDFDPKSYYEEGFDVKNRTKQNQMGVVSNLIADMTLKGASPEELARAVKHSMVVIDSEKHHLNYKQSAKDNNIRELTQKYQDGGGASTLITRSKSELRVPKRREAYKHDEKTGEKVYIETPETYVNKEGKTVERTTKTTKMAETKDARSLMSSEEGLPMERLYADYANNLKSLANKSRLQSMNIQETKRNPSAAKFYENEVNSLNAKLNEAQKNKPRERQAQLIANAVVSAKKRDNPGMDSDTLKKMKGQALSAARARVGAKKQKVSFTDKEWEAVQSGAIGSTKLKQLLNNADLDEVKKLATPRKSQSSLSSSQISRIKAMNNSTYTIEEIAKALGISASTVSKYIK